MSGLCSRCQTGAEPRHRSGTPWGWGVLPWSPAPAAFPVGNSAQSEQAKPSLWRQRSRASALSPAAVLLVPRGRCPLCPARWQLSPSVATEPQSGLSSVYTALAPAEVSQHSCFSLTQARSCVPCPLRHNVPAWRLRGSSQGSAVVEAERGPCVRHSARSRVRVVWG